MRLGTADYAAIGICVNAFRCGYGIDFVIEIADVTFATNVQLISVLFCMHFMMITGVQCGVVIYVIVLIHVGLLSACEYKLFGIHESKALQDICIKKAVE